jgi:uncharacterized protein
MKSLLLLTLSAYKKFFSPWLPNACRFVPTCSEYAEEAVQRHGVFYGAVLSVWRMIRCNPFSKGGLDLVPLGHFVSRKGPQSQSAVCSHLAQSNRG